MNYLVRFQEDNLYYICREQHIRVNNDVCSIMYRGGRYAGTVVCKNSNYDVLNGIVSNLNNNLPILNIDKNLQDASLNDGLTSDVENDNNTSFQTLPVETQNSSAVPGVEIFSLNEKIVTTFKGEDFQQKPLLCSDSTVVQQSIIDEGKLS